MSVTRTPSASPLSNRPEISQSEDEAKIGAARSDLEQALPFAREHKVVLEGNELTSVPEAKGQGVDRQEAAAIVQWLANSNHDRLSLLPAINQMADAGTLSDKEASMLRSAVEKLFPRS